MTMQYEIPTEATVVKRLFIRDSMVDDNFAIIADDELITVVDYETARGYWLGRVTLGDLLELQQDA